MFFKKLGLFLSILALNVFAQENSYSVWQVNQASYADSADAKSMGVAFSVLPLPSQNTINPKKLSQKNIVDRSFWEDYNMFYGNPKNPKKHALNQINRTRTKIGYATLANRLTEVESDIAELQRRQEIVKEFINNPNMGQINQILDVYANTESVLYQIFDPVKEENILLTLKDYYFSTIKLQKYNDNAYVLDVKRVMPLVYNFFKLYLIYVGLKNSINIIISQHSSGLVEDIPERAREAAVAFYDNSTKDLMAKIKTAYVFMKEYWRRLLNENNDPNTYLFSAAGEIIGNGIITLGSISNALYYSYISNKDLGTLNGYNASVFKTINLCKQLNVLIDSNSTLALNLKYFKNINSILNNPSENFKKLINICVSPNKPTYGGMLAGFKLALNCKEELAQLAQAIGEIDMYCSLANLLKNQDESSPNKFRMVHYIDSKLPYARLDTCWNVLLGSQQAIANTVVLGASGAEGHNMILTGTNESGKSTLQKSILISLILAQTIGIAPANSMELRPFDRIKYYKGDTDNITEGKSLFRVQAEEFNKLFTIVPGEITYLSIDEPPTGANARNCAALSFAAAKQLQKSPWYTATISTHYPLLTGLEKQTNGFYKNYKFTNPEESAPYKLVEGVSDQHREFEILRKAGLNEQILNDAINMIKNDEDLNILPIKSKL